MPVTTAATRIAASRTVRCALPLGRGVGAIFKVTGTNGGDDRNVHAEIHAARILAAAVGGIVEAGLVVDGKIDGKNITDADSAGILEQLGTAIVPQREAARARRRLLRICRHLRRFPIGETGPYRAHRWRLTNLTQGLRVASGQDESKNGNG
jgi:hypothetical protein